jgi:hypothetical protein
VARLQTRCLAGNAAPVIDAADNRASYRRRFLVRPLLGYLTGWGHMAPRETELKKAAAGVDARRVSIALKMVLMLEKAECRPARPID